jgi:uracil-DNA glycosylase family 4
MPDPPHTPRPRRRPARTAQALDVQRHLGCRLRPAPRTLVRVPGWVADPGAIDRDDRTPSAGGAGRVGSVDQDWEGSRAPFRGSASISYADEMDSEGRLRSRYRGTAGARSECRARGAARRGGPAPAVVRATGSPRGYHGRDVSLRVLQARIVACRRCPRLVRHRAAVAARPPRRYRGQRYWARPVPSLGAASARLLLVGLAPAAHGGNRTGRMFTGDAPGGSGEWLARALHAHGFATQPTSRRRGDGFRLIDAYLTAALHCVPPANRPAAAELRRCGPYLAEELRLLRRVRVVMGLGRIGFDAYLAAAAANGLPVPRPRPRFTHGGATRLPWGVTLLGTYHPSRQNTQTGRLTWPMFDAVFAAARRHLDGIQASTPAQRSAPGGVRSATRAARAASPPAAGRAGASPPGPRRSPTRSRSGSAGR